MRIISFILSTIITITLIYSLNKKWGSIPPLGKLLSPQQGFWQNAEAVNLERRENFSFKDLKGKVNVYIDQRLVPHVFAQHDEDVYFIQGFLHAKYRLWQMEFQTFAAAGRIAEKLGNNPQYIRYDREQRRMGMVYGAENALKAMNADSSHKKFFDAYTKGVNAYIGSLTEAQLPIEYKILDYRPEPWSNLKTALFLKLMSNDLTGYESDLDFTNEKTVFGAREMDILYPQFSDSTRPIVPKGTIFNSPTFVPVKPSTADSIYFGKDTSVEANQHYKPNPLNGSNNWALSGKKTKSGAPILCNDPHLGLTLPSIWFEMQLTTPTMNVYGATFPGSPNVIIGFNDSVAFGFTNAMRDVKDYYSIKFKDETRREYWFNNQWQPTKLRIEHIKIRDEETLNDTVAYTFFGPVMYDQSMSIESTKNMALAVRWIAHDSSNDGSMWFNLDRAKNYSDYLNAIKDFSCPGQNMLVATSSGDIGLWQQGKFPARWPGQGLYIMPGQDSSYMWQGFIPQAENPHILNPEQGYIESANQRPVDTSYPYFIPGNYFEPRGRTLDEQLAKLQQATPKDMMALQNDVYNSQAAEAIPLLFKYINESKISNIAKKYLNELNNWDFRVTANSRPSTIYYAWLDSLYKNIWWDEFSIFKKASITIPDMQTTLEDILRDSAFKFIDDIHTPQVETLSDQVTKSFNQAVSHLSVEESKNGLLWWKHKNSIIKHLLRDAVMPFAGPVMQVGGWKETISAITDTHGPSWRMIVQLTNPIEAYGIYPGGQSGNPGSRFYDNSIDNWTKGKYYKLWVMKESESNDSRIISTLTFINS